MGTGAKPKPSGDLPEAAEFAKRKTQANFPARFAPATENNAGYRPKEGGSPKTADGVRQFGQERSDVPRRGEAP